MRRQILSLAAIALMLSACAGTGGRDQTVTQHQPVDDHEDRRPAVSTDNHYPTPTDRRLHDHHHPSPEEVYAGQIALLFSAQIFACAFVVVILDGSCNFYASTGYYY